MIIKQPITNHVYLGINKSSIEHLEKCNISYIILENTEELISIKDLIEQIIFYDDVVCFYTVLRKDIISLYLDDKVKYFRFYKNIGDIIKLFQKTSHTNDDILIKQYVYVNKFWKRK
jgi:hypothetical protein